jgi:hypothetical protein
MLKFELFFSYADSSDFVPPSPLPSSISDTLEYFDGGTPDIRRKGLHALYCLLLTPAASPCPTEQHLAQATKEILDQGGLSLLIHNLAFLASQLQPSRDLILEQDLRLLLGILYATLVFPPQDEVKNELSQYSAIIEEALLGLIKMSTDISYMPMKKICMVLVKYLELVLDTPVKHSKISETTGKEIPRIKTGGTAVELFYV